MKKIDLTVIFLLFFSSQFFAQIKNLNKEQIQFYRNKAKVFETNKQFEEALRLYYFIAERDSISSFKKLIDNKIDSLIPIIRNETILKLNGKWKLVKNIESDSTNINFTEFIEFKNSKIMFYDNRYKIQTIELILEPIKSNIFDSILGLKIGENETWSLSFREINNESRLIWKKRIDKNGHIWGMIDDRGIIRDPIKRKEALEGEIHTYYKAIK